MDYVVYTEFYTDGWFTCWPTLHTYVRDVQKAADDTAAAAAAAALPGKYYIFVRSALACYYTV